MESIYGDLPAPLAAARRIGLMRYADFEDLRAGRMREVAERVLGRAHRWRLALVLVPSAMLARAALDAALAPEPAGLASLLCTVLWLGCVVPCFLALSARIRGLGALARAGSA